MIGDAQARTARAGGSGGDAGEQTRVNAARWACNRARARARLRLNARRKEAQCSADKQDCLARGHLSSLLGESLRSFKLVRWRIENAKAIGCVEAIVVVRDAAGADQKRWLR